VPSEARHAFDENAGDVKRLVQLHERIGGAEPGRKHGLEVLSKSAIVLITAIWEAYCEDIAAEALEFIVKEAKGPSSLPKELRKRIAKEQKDDKNELAVWRLAGDGWRQLVTSRLGQLREKRNWDFSNPRASQIDKLFADALGEEKISDAWSWQGMSVKDAKEKLDRYVTIRGQIAHRGKGLKSIKKSDVSDYFEHVKHLVAKTGGRINKFVKKATGRGLWDSSDRSDRSAPALKISRRDIM